MCSVIGTYISALSSKKYKASLITAGLKPSSMRVTFRCLKVPVISMVSWKTSNNHLRAGESRFCVIPRYPVFRTSTRGPSVEVFFLPLKLDDHMWGESLQTVQNGAEESVTWWASSIPGIFWLMVGWGKESCTHRQLFFSACLWHWRLVSSSVNRWWSEDISTFMSLNRHCKACQCFMNINRNNRLTLAISGNLTLLFSHLQLQNHRAQGPKVRVLN